MGGLNELGAYYKENHLRSKSRSKYPTNGIPAKPSTYTLTCLSWHHTRPLTHLPKPLPEDAPKLSSRNNLLRKLHGTDRGACHHTTRTTATSLCLSVAEYCCPVWSCSTHRKLVDTTLLNTMEVNTLRMCSLPPTDNVFTSTEDVFTSIDDVFTSIDDTFTSTEDVFTSIDDVFTFIDDVFTSIDDVFTSTH